MFDPPAKSGLGCCCRERLRVDSAELTTPTVFVASPHSRCHYGDGRDWIRRWPMMELTCPGPDSNRHGRLKPRDFKSLASTDFATRAWAQPY